MNVHITLTSFDFTQPTIFLNPAVNTRKTLVNRLLKRLVHDLMKPKKAEDKKLCTLELHFF